MEPHRRNFGSQVSGNWEDKSPSDDFNEVPVHGAQLHRFSFSSNGGSRSGSRITSSPASHRRTISESMLSQGVSPSDSFRTSQWSFLAGQGGDFIFAAPDPNASPSVAHAKECYMDTQRERLRWTSATSPSDFVISEDSSDTVEQMRSAGLLKPAVELLTCGVCARWLYQRSPLSYPPVVGVLSCGHVFHADCLEQSISQTQKQDPPCPQCSPPEKPSKVAAVSSSRGFLKSISHASSSTKNKLSRVGVMTDDGLPVGTAKAPHLHRLPSSSGVKSQISSFFSERAKPFSKRAFPFKSRRDSVISDGKFRKPASPARVSPAKDFMDVNPQIKDSLRV